MPRTVAQLNTVDEFTPNHMHGRLQHGTNTLLVLPWLLLHPKATDLQKTPTASQEEDLPGGATKGRDATNFGEYYSFSPHHIWEGWECQTLPAGLGCNYVRLIYPCNYIVWCHLGFHRATTRKFPHSDSLPVCYPARHC